jgi:hypothetical protein
MFDHTLIIKQHAIYAYSCFADRHQTDLKDWFSAAHPATTYAASANPTLIFP